MNLSLDSNLTSQLKNDSDHLIYENLDRIQLIADIGYLLSLLTLVFALLILTCIQRLRCPKNNLHLQLFISFIIRCWFHWIQRLFLHEQLPYTLDPDVSMRLLYIGKTKRLSEQLSMFNRIEIMLILSFLLGLDM